MKTVEELEEILKEKFVISDTPCNRTYIFPDGKFLHIPLYNTTHGSVKDFLDSKGLIPEDNVNTSNCQYLEDLGVIRANLRNEGFICLSKTKPTSAQYDSLREFIDKYKDSCIYRYRYKFYLIEPKPEFTIHEFEPRDLDSDEIIRLIKQYYATGRLIEKVAEKGEL